MEKLKVLKAKPPFIAVVGNEGSGKTTLINRLDTLYKERGMSVVTSFEPGGTPIGVEFRRILKDPQYHGTFPPLSELFGFLASRAAYIEHVVKPALNAGSIVLTDRFSMCTMAYQIAGRGLPEDECMTAIKLAEGGVHAKYVVLLASQDVGAKRKQKQGDFGDRFDKESSEFHRKVHEGYIRYGVREFGAILIDTDRMTQDEVFEKAKRELDDRYWGSLRPFLGYQKE